MNPENKLTEQSPYTLNLYAQYAPLPYPIGLCSQNTAIPYPLSQSSHTYTLSQWLDEWMNIYKMCSVKPQTAIIYKEIITLIKTCPESSLLLTDCTERNMQRLLNSLQNRQATGRKTTYSRSILNKVRMMIIAALKTAKKERIIAINPCTELITPIAPTKKVMPLSHTEQELVEQACHVDPLGHLYIFLLGTGLRLSELINLQWSDYDPIERTINITASKTPAGIRVVYLLKEAQNIIEAQPRLGKYIFYHTKGQPITKSVMRRLTDRLRQTSKVDHLTPHVCRHTFVTRLCEYGVPAKSIAQIIGHSQSDYVLDIYAMMEKQELRKAIYVLENNSEDNQQ